MISKYLRSYGPFLGNLRFLWKNSRWAIRLTRNTNPRLLAYLIGCAVFRSIIPLGLMLSARGIVNSVVMLHGNKGTMTELFMWLGIGFGCAVIEATGKFSTQLIMLRLKDEINLNVNTMILDHALTLDLSRFEDPELQDMMARCRQDLAQNFSVFLDHLMLILAYTIQILSLVGLLFVIEPLVVMMLIPLAIPYLFHQWRLAKTKYNLEVSRTTKRRWTTYFLSRLLRHEHVPEVKLFDLGELLKNEFRKHMSQFRDQDKKLYYRSYIVSIVFSLLTTMAAYLAFTRVVYGVLDGSLTVGDVAVFGGAALRLRDLIELMVNSVTRVVEETLYISNLNDFLAVKPRMDAKKGSAVESNRGAIELDGVTFSYPGAAEPTLKDISFRIGPGETVALVGENGAGKSTLVKLIARLYDPDEGAVLFDGRDLRTLNIEDYHRKLSFVFQDFGRYEGTVADNIAYGNWSEMGHNRDRIEEVAGKSGVHEMISRMPDGYDTNLGREFGEFTLSSGQWQQIALARAFSRNASLLILDEPTASMDARAEHDLFIRFKALARNRTTILISHRFSTVTMADRIIVVDKGRLIEHGTHEELLRYGGHYAMLFNLHQLQMTPD